MSDATRANVLRVSDDLWRTMEPLLPEPDRSSRERSAVGGRPRRPARDRFDAIFFVLRTGCPWNALDATGICPSSTAHDRFEQRVEDGFFERLWDAGLLAYEQCRGIDRSFLSIDGSQTKAPLGGEKTGPNPTDRGTRGVQRSLATDPPPPPPPSPPPRLPPRTSAGLQSRVGYASRSASRCAVPQMNGATNPP